MMHPSMSLAYQLENVAKVPTYGIPEPVFTQVKFAQEHRFNGAGLKILLHMEPGEGYTSINLQESLGMSRSIVNKAMMHFFQNLGYVKIQQKTINRWGQTTRLYYLTPLGLSIKEHLNDLCDD